jgi:hypothetical protein
MTPPTLSSGSASNLNCGWHGACGATPTAGTALDWEDGGTNYGNPWYFRGVFAISNPNGAIIATGVPLVNQSGSDRCDIMTVWIVEKFSGALRAAPIYEHVNIATNSAQFNISGTLFGTYLSRQIGTTIDDTGGCIFYGSHVHEDDASVGGTATTSRHTSLYPTGAQCSNLNCGTFPNNNASNWTRKFSWPEGS